MTLVQSVAGKMDRPQFEVFSAMLRTFMLLGIPTAGLQTSFAQQGAAALTPDARAQLAALTRWVLGGIVVAWLLVVLAAFLGRDAIYTQLKLGDGSALWPTLGVGLLFLFRPVLNGLLQGQQDFSTLGWVAILDGFLRLSLILVTVLLLHLGATAALTVAFVAMLVSTSIALGRTRGIWCGPGAPVAWRHWLARVLPFTLGAGAIQLLAYVDVVYLKAIIPEEQADRFGLGDRYIPAVLIGFALVQFTVPLATVMFPKIARSAAGGGSSDALTLALTGTLILGSLAAGFVTVFPRLPLSIVFFTKPAALAAAPLVPWYAWAMVAFTLANVLVSNLLARERFVIVPWTMAVVGGYLATLIGLKGHLLTLEPVAAYRLVSQVIGGSSLLLFAIAACLTWGGRRIQVGSSR